MVAGDRSDGSDSRVQGRWISRDGVLGEILDLSQGGHDVSRPQVAMQNQGYAVVVWNWPIPGGDRIQARRLYEGGPELSHVPVTRERERQRPRDRVDEAQRLRVRGVEARRRPDGEDQGSLHWLHRPQRWGLEPLARRPLVRAPQAAVSDDDEIAVYLMSDGTNDRVHERRLSGGLLDPDRILKLGGRRRRRLPGSRWTMCSATRSRRGRARDPVNAIQRIQARLKIPSTEAPGGSVLTALEDRRGTTAARADGAQDRAAERRLDGGLGQRHGPPRSPGASARCLGDRGPRHRGRPRLDPVRRGRAVDRQRRRRQRDHGLARRAGLLRRQGQGRPGALAPSRYRALYVSGVCTDSASVSDATTRKMRSTPVSEMSWATVPPGYTTITGRRSGPRTREVSIREASPLESMNVHSVSR